GYVGDGYAYVTGLDVKSTAAPGYGSIATIDNAARIEGHAVGYGAIVYGTGARAVGDTIDFDNEAGAYILATATTELFGGAFATAVEASGVHGIDIVNDGTIVAIGSAHADTIYYGASRAVGIVAEASIYGDISVVNNGDIIANATADSVVTFFGGGAGATGIDTYAKYDAVVDNAGDITASAITEFGIAGATGAVVHGKYYGHMVNSGDIVAYAYAGSLATDSYAARTAASGVRLFYAEVGITENTGSIVATAISHAEDGHYAGDTIAFAYGTLTDAWRSVGIVNSGDIEANAQADFGDARAYGSMVRGGYDATTDNTGTMIARADAQGGAALAVGSYTFAQIFEYLGCDDTGCHYEAVAGDASLSNGGDIVAIASAEGGIADAYGAIVIALDNATVDNTGTIVARAEGDDANAMGVLMSSEGGSNTLHNAGTIAAFGDGDRFAVWSSNDAIASIDNAGTLIGAVRTGDRDDTFGNAGTWHAVGVSDFGAGDDRVTNAGTMLLEDATVHLGAATTANVFANAGTMRVSGASTLDMGGAFVARNDGLLSFADGAADDALTIVGDLAGEGSIAFDVAAGSGASDLLTVDGTIDASTLQTIDVHLVDLPGAAHAEIPLVAIAGDASLDQFALGRVDHATDGFLAMSFGLGARVDAANASPDVVMLEVGVDGLNAMGALAASIAPAALHLVDTTVGTWRQRVGIVPDAPSDSGLSPWVRGFADSGEAAPDYEGFAPVGGGGFHQSSQGWEFGLEARVLEHIAVGALVSTADATQRLDATPGEDRLDATTFGLYATWLPIGGGTYVDASMRWTGFDVRLQAPTGTHETNASAQTFNVEGGHVFTLGNGLRVIPQLQYTYTHIADIGPLQGDQSTFETRGGDASRARLGVGFERSFENAGVTWTPYGSVNAVHAFDGRFAYSVGDAFGGAATVDGTGAMVEGGLGASVGKFTVTGGVQWADGGTSDGAFGGQLVLRYRW
ncbi:MAG: autotransporter domain-containing protein, partial [Lysobacter sp.]|nr:autotransporter domain-containing protein [Lysobacter sp.]